MNTLASPRAEAPADRHAAARRAARRADRPDPRNACLAGLAGIPYQRGAAGGDAIDCWNLTRQACERWHGQAPPLLADRVAPLVRGAVAQGWRRVPYCPRPGDLLVMRTASGDRHAGFVLRVQRRLQLLHAVHGGSGHQPLADLPLLGFSRFELWRLCAPKGTAA